MAALLVVAGSLFALRYGLSRRLDLKQPLANFLPESLKSNRRTEQANDRRRDPKQAPQVPDDNGDGADRDQAAKAEQNPDQQTPSDGQAESEGQPNANAKAPGKKQNQQPDSQMATDDQQQGNDSAAQNSDQSQDGQQGDSKNAAAAAAGQGRQQAGRQRLRRKLQPDGQDEGRLPEPALAGQAAAATAERPAAGPERSTGQVAAGRQTTEFETGAAAERRPAGRRAGRRERRAGQERREQPAAKGPGQERFAAGDQAAGQRCGQSGRGQGDQERRAIGRPWAS